jgi:thioredoxin 1
MPFNPDYISNEPPRSEIDALAGATLLEFGSPWCGHCRRAAPLVQQALTGHPGVRHLKIEDGSGRPLGRSFRVKLWPTLIFLKDGQETGRLVRPQDGGEIAAALDTIDSSAAT